MKTQNSEVKEHTGPDLLVRPAVEPYIRHIGLNHAKQSAVVLRWVRANIILITSESFSLNILLHNSHSYLFEISIFVSIHCDSDQKSIEFLLFL